MRTRNAILAATLVVTALGLYVSRCAPAWRRERGLATVPVSPETSTTHEASALRDPSVPAPAPVEPERAPSVREPLVPHRRTGIEVRVTLGGTRPAVGASVEVGSTSGRLRGTTDGGGRVFLPVAKWPAHEIQVIPAQQGYEWKRVNLADRRAEMQGECVLAVEVVLGLGGRAVVEVVEEGGSPLSGHLVEADYLGKEERTTKWRKRLGFTDAAGRVEFTGLALGEWSFSVPEWRNFARSEHEHEDDTGQFQADVVAAGIVLAIRREVRARNEERYASGRLLDLAGQEASEGMLVDFRLEPQDRKGDMLIHADGAFFVFRTVPSKVRVKRLSSRRTSRWLELAPGVHLGDLLVPW